MVYSITVVTQKGKKKKVLKVMDRHMEQMKKEIDKLGLLSIYRKVESKTYGNSQNHT